MLNINTSNLIDVYCDGNLGYITEASMLNNQSTIEVFDYNAPSQWVKSSLPIGVYLGELYIVPPDNTNFFAVGQCNLPDGNNIIINGNSFSQINGGAGNDMFSDFSPGITINGGDGLNTLTLSLTADNYKLTNIGNTLEFTIDLSGKKMVLQNIERIRFSDMSLALDLNGNAGIAAKVLGVAFGSSYIFNDKYVSIALNYLDSGTSYQQLMQIALLANLGVGINDPSKVVDTLYFNLVGVHPGQTNLNYFVGLLNSHIYTTATLGTYAAETILNENNINLIGLSKAGIYYSEH